MLLVLCFHVGFCAVFVGVIIDCCRFLDLLLYLFLVLVVGQTVQVYEKWLLSWGKGIFLQTKAHASHIVLIILHTFAC